MSEKLKTSVALNSNVDLKIQNHLTFRFFLLFFKLILTLPLGILREVKVPLILIKIFLKNVKCESCVSILTWNLSKAHLYILSFDKPTETSTKGKRLKYTEFIILLRIPNGSVDINSFWLERIEMRVLLLDLQLEIRIENTTSF